MNTISKKKKKWNELLTLLEDSGDTLNQRLLRARDDKVDLQLHTHIFKQKKKDRLPLGLRSQMIERMPAFSYFHISSYRSGCLEPVRSFMIQSLARSLAL
jgi:hypothetical protein